METQAEPCSSEKSLSAAPAVEVDSSSSQMTQTLKPVTMRSAVIQPWTASSSILNLVQSENHMGLEMEEED